MKHLLLFLSLTLGLTVYSQNVGISETNPASKLSVKGSASVGSAYSTTAAPVNGAIIQGNVGIGTTAPITSLHIVGSGILAQGSFGVAGVPVSGSGVRMMWIEGYGSFRAGFVNGSEWDQANVGSYSVAMGVSTIASATSSTAFGEGTVASGLSSFAVGAGCIASNGGCAAMGVSTLASGQSAFAMGYLSHATGDFGGALGYSAYAFSAGEVALGMFNTAYTPTNTNGWSANDRVLTVGNGQSVGTPSDAMVILKNGNTGLGISTPANRLEVAGNTKTTSFQMTSGANSTYLLQSDASGNATWASPATASQNIYNANGSLAASRTVTMGANNLTFSSTTGDLIFSPSGTTGSMGIGVVPGGTNRLDVAQTLSGTATAGAVINATGTFSNTNNVITSGLNVNASFTGTGNPGYVFGENITVTGGSEDTRGLVITTSSTASNYGLLVNGGKVGIGTVSPTTTLHVVGDGVLATGTIGTGKIPTTGAGTRMMWYPCLGAFRAGGVAGTNWDSANVGQYSVAMGYDDIASGYGSVACGEGNTVSGEGSASFGITNLVSGIASVACGKNNYLYGNLTGVFGNTNTSHGNNNFLAGQSCGATNDNCIALGYGSFAAGFNSTALGFASAANGDNSVAIGYSVLAASYGEMVVGAYSSTYTPASSTSWVGSDRLFVVGNGTYSLHDNALVILKNGKTGIGTNTPNFLLDVEGGPTGLSSAAAETYFNTSNLTTLTHSVSATTGQVSIYASNYIASAAGFVAHSDQRLKNIIGRSDAASDLSILRDIEVTDYTMRDEATNKGTIKKVIAQQVQSVYPQAVMNAEGAKYVANLHQLTDQYTVNEKTITFTLAKGIEFKDKMDISQGSSIKLYLNGKNTETAIKEVIGTIEVINGNTYTVGLTERIDVAQYDKLFVYGTEVCDLLTVDYEAISMLNVSATQELAKEVFELELANKTLQSENENIHSDVDKLKVSVEVLQQIMGSKAQK